MMLDWGFEPNLSHLGSFPPPLSRGNLYLIHFFCILDLAHLQHTEMF